MDSHSRLLLVDGHALAYRAFYAIRELTTSDGRPTNAVYGFIRMLKQMQRQWEPTHAVVVFDGGLPDERMELLPTYKAQRQPMPEALDEQFPLIEEFLALSGIGVVRQERQEADDLLAAITQRAREQGAEVMLATSDKDLFQLVGERVAIIPPSKAEIRMGPAEVKEKTGVPPEQIAEWLALIGDSSDNIPGVPGVGAKTAARLLAEYGSVEGIYEHVNDIKQDKLRTALTTHRDDVLRNLKMTRLRADLPVTLDWESWRTDKAGSSGLLAFLKRMEFKSMAAELESPSLFSE